MALVGAAALAGFGFAVKTAADFEKGLSAVAAVSGASGKELDQLRAKALQLGKDTKFSAAEAVSAMEELAKAGVSTADILGGAADATVALAAAGEVSLPEAASIASNAMNAFGLSAQELPRVADLIAGAANASAIDVGEFAQSLQQSGAVAHLAGVSFDDLSVAIAELGNAGIKGSDAGTSLKTMLQNLNPTTDKQKKLMKDLGIVTKEGANQFFDAQGKAKGLADISQVLNTALKGMTKQQKLAALETLFGSDAIRAAAILADQGAAGFNKLATQMGKVKAADVAAKRMDNLAGSIEQFKGSLETALIQAGTPAQAGLRQLVDGATRLVNAFVNLSPQTQKLIGQFAVFGGLALLASAGFIKLFIGLVRFGEAIRTAATLMKAFGLASKLAFVTNPVFLIIAAIVALVAIFVVLFNKNKAFHDFVVTAWNNILGVVKNVVNAFKALGAAFSGGGITTEASSLVGVFERIGVAARAFVAIVVAAFRATVAGIRAAWSTLAPIIAPVIAFIVNQIRTMVGVVVGLVKLFAALLTGNWTAAWNAIKSIASTILNGIRGAISAVLAFILANWQAWGAALIGIIARTAVTALAAFGNFINQLPGRVAFVIGFIIGRFVRLAIQLGVLAAQAGSAVVRGIVSFLVQLPGRVNSFLLTTGARMASFAGRFASLAAQAGSRALSAIVRFLSQLPGRLAGLLARALAAMARFASQLPSMAARAARGAYNAVSAGIGGIPGLVSGIFGRAVSAISGVAQRAFAAAAAVARNLWNGFKKGLFGSPRTLIEYAMIGMVKGFDEQLSNFESQQAQFARIAGAFASRDTMLRQGALAAGSLGRSAGTTSPTTPTTTAAEGGSTQPLHVSLNIKGRTIAEVLIPDIRQADKRQNWLDGLT